MIKGRWCECLTNAPRRGDLRSERVESLEIDIF